jgi:anti-anti-sigma factor
MEIKTERFENIKKIKIAGDIILSEIKTLKNEIEDIKNYPEIHFDLAEVNYANSSFLNFIISLKNEYPGTKIKIYNPNDFLLELLSITGFKRFFEIVTEK